MRTHGRLLATVIGIVLVMFSVPPAQAASAAGELDRYWTPQRMRDAVPAAGGPHVASTQFDGIPIVGQLFITEDGEDKLCTATVVQSPGKNLLVSAAHCFLDDERQTNLAFVPQYHDGQKPFGVFPVKRGQIYLDDRYVQLGVNRGADLDFAFLVVEPREDGRNVEEVVGGAELGINLPFEHDPARLIGYPGERDGPLDCVNKTTRFNSPEADIPGSFLKIDCAGFSPGTSGGPFLLPHGDGFQVFGVVGGFKTGGDTDDTSYSSYFDDDVVAEYRKAVGESDTGHPVLGNARTWQHAKILTSGHFTGDPDSSDLVVVWDDGELTLYRGADEQTGYFDQEITLARPRSVWTHAVTVTAGDFAGGAGDDLVVRWADGELTLYPDVNETGLHGEIQLQPPNGLWTHAKSITAGSFTNDSADTDDLVVGWDDGELTLYQNVDGAGLHAETQLAAPGGDWSHAVTVTSGDFTGNDNYDLMVRWVDGEVTLYPDVDEDGLHGEHRMQPPNDLWKHAVVISAGSFNSNGWPDDLIVRWVDGELGMHTDTDEAGLHAEVTLVDPPL
ncbi:serine protease family protein [Lentzea tibetensis]|uniref:hypothetical protein n=1 Tax=Lentzea tibetensis TaxID=2591470 RepID=UPI00164637FD|nr:hypothetical protein [Lentzea tibetensis]